MTSATKTEPETPYRIHVPDESLHNLKQKLLLSTFPDELDGAGWKYGVPLVGVQRLVKRWKDGFNWRMQEALLNESLPQFTRNIEVEGHGTLNIHYVHQRSEVANAIPLLFVHGWPGSFIEVQKILPLLTEKGDHPSFHVVAISLPGYGFSEAPKKQGFRSAHYAAVANSLMITLGYDHYVTQGGDWGFYITRKIASLYGTKHAMAWHTNFPVSEPPTFSSSPLLWIQHLITPYKPAEIKGLARRHWFSSQGRGYFHEQSTQPQTLGYALADSPVGLLAWIYEKLVNWSDDYAWNDDEILTWVSIYYFSRAGPAASLRIYYELTQGNDRTMAPGDRPTIPLGVSYFPEELRSGPRIWMYNTGNVVAQYEHTVGGHFAAHEQPAALVADLRDMFGKNGAAFGVVPGLDGY